jgi:predicted metal-dependent HD superfamily phosphohydrolase
MITTHRELPSQRDEQFIADIDLSSFGLSWDKFERDGRRIRAECAHMSDDEYYPGHAKFLQALRERPTFFFTQFFQRRYEQTARENIERLITSLHRRGYY